MRRYQLCARRRQSVLLYVMACSFVSSPLPLSAQTVGPETIAVQSTSKPVHTASLQRRINLDLTNVKIDRIIDEIAEKSGVKITYASGLMAEVPRLTIQATQITAQDALERILKGTGIQISTVEGRVALVKRTPGTRVVSQGTSEITGRVTDSASGKNIAGVNVAVSGMRLTVITNERGEFAIPNVPAGEQRVTFKLLGYESVTRSVTVEAGKPLILRVTLKEAASMLSEVVTTVTGQQKKMEIGNDITTINVPEVMKQAPITSVTDLLEARVPGLTVMRTSGVPGAPSRIRLRGIGGGLLSGVSGAPTNDPIVIVDGIRIYAGQSGVDDQKLGGGKYPTPSPIDQIDPNSIEKIEVLRGPSAAAMYGSDAGDGVIVITTKKGSPGSRRWDISASRGTESMPGTYAAPGFYRFGHQPRGAYPTAQVLCPSIRAPADYFNCVPDSIVRFQALDDPRLSTVGRGHSTRISGTVSGGSRDLTYSVTGSMANSLGLTKMPVLYQDLFRRLYDSTPSERMRRPNVFDSRSGQLSLQGEFGDGVNATYTTSLSQTVQNQSSANDQLSKLSSMYIDTGNINPGRPGEYAYQLNVKNNSAMHAVALNMLRWNWFHMTATVGMDRVERSSEGLTPRGIVIVTYETNSSSGYPVIGTVMSKGKFTERRENINTNTGRINGTLFPGSRISLSMGSEVTQVSNSTIAGESDTLVDGVSRPATLVTASRTGRSTTTGGWFVEPRLNMNSRFFVNPGFRIDGGGVSGKRGGFQGGLLSLFPKLNFSWIAIDRENEEPLWGVISLLRPRLAFGVAGVQPAAEWTVRTLQQDVGGWRPDSLGTIAPDLGLRIRSVGNTRLGPEKTQEVEGGFDVQLLNTRLTLSATGFYKIRRNAIEQLPLAPSVGAGGETEDMLLKYYSNIGHVRNTGAELSINAMIIDRPGFGWNIDMSVSRYTNKLTKLYGDRKEIDLGYGTRLVEGYPLFSRWSKPISGWTEPVNGAKLWYGDFVIADSAVYIGMQAPDFEMPVRTSITLLRGLLTVNGQFNYKAGLTQNNLGGGALLSNIYNNPNSTYAQQAYALAAAVYGYGVDGSLNNGTDYGFIQKVNSLRFNSMSIGYNVPRDYLKRFPMSSMSLSLQGSNLGLWTNYRGKDPDVNGNLIGDVTQDSGQLPMPRTWSLQVRIGT